MRNQQRASRAIRLVPGLLLAFAINSGMATAGGPSVSMKVAPASGFRGQSERVVKPGWVVDTFSDSHSTTVHVFGRAGSAVDFGGGIERATNGNLGTLSFSVASPPNADPKVAAGGGGGEAVGAVEALIALGVDPKTALAEFGGMDSLDGATPPSDIALAEAATASASAAAPEPPLATLASTRALAAQTVAATATTSTTTPWDTQCATVNSVGGLVQGYGCSTIYLVKR